MANIIYDTDKNYCCVCNKLISLIDAYVYNDVDGNPRTWCKIHGFTVDRDNNVIVPGTGGQYD